tara:strand:+ start:332 stop:547 length:216 start_codon:yes stop_codon:yes gene_type:complete
MTDTITVTVEARQLGGFNPDFSYYPVSASAKLLASIAGTATLTERVLHLLRDSKQYTIKIIRPALLFGEAK